MVKIELLSNENGICQYNYQPEGIGKPGVIKYDYNNDIEETVALAEEDSEYGTSRRHAFNNITRHIRENGSLPNDMVISWY